MYIKGLVIVCLTIVTLTLIATFRPHTAGRNYRLLGRPAVCGRNVAINIKVTIVRQTRGQTLN